MRLLVWSREPSQQGLGCQQQPWLAMQQRVLAWDIALVLQRLKHLSLVA
jgi:hypothetical protein